MNDTQTQQRHIVLCGGVITYTLRYSARARRVRVAVYGGGDCIITAPRGIRDAHIEWMLARHARWIVEKINQFKRLPREIPSRHTKAEYRAYKERARTLAMERIAFWNARYGCAIGRIAIRNSKTRWGSCSRKGNLNFSYKIALLPPQLADYIIVHELCHLRAFNHSRTFWKLVAMTIPNHREMRRALRAWRG
jgi:hypothetical protein